MFLECKTKFHMKVEFKISFDVSLFCAEIERKKM